MTYGDDIWRKDLDLHSRSALSFHLKRKELQIVPILVFDGYQFRLDIEDLDRLERALTATKDQLSASALRLLALDRKAKDAKLGTVAKLWQWAMNTPLWEIDVMLRSPSKISFRIKCEGDWHAYIVFTGVEELRAIPVDISELEILREAVLEAMATLELMARTDVVRSQNQQ